MSTTPTARARRACVATLLALAVLVLAPPADADAAVTSLLQSRCATGSFTTGGAVDGELRVCADVLLMPAASRTSDALAPFQAEAVAVGVTANVGVRCAPDGTTPATGGQPGAAVAYGLINQGRQNLECIATAITAGDSTTVKLVLTWGPRDWCVVPGTCGT